MLTEHKYNYSILLPTWKYPKHRSWRWLHQASSHCASPQRSFACTKSKHAWQSRIWLNGGRTGTGEPPGTQCHYAFFQRIHLPPGSPVQNTSHPERQNTSASVTGKNEKYTSYPYWERENHLNKKDAVQPTKKQNCSEVQILNFLIHQPIMILKWQCQDVHLNNY